MKLNVDKNDFIKFCAIALFILYLCCILVLNISSLAKEGEFSGLLPFRAFTKEYIGLTFFLFVAVVVGVLLSVNSYIFEGEKGSGFGFSFEKKGNGYARWATKNEVKKQLKEVDPKAYNADAAGIVVMNDDKKL